MKKYYYENRLATENISTKTNLVWVADITEIEIDQQKKLFIFLCVDINLKKIISNQISRKIITSSVIVLRKVFFRMELQLDFQVVMKDFSMIL